MPRKNLTGSWGESRAMTVRLTAAEHRAISTLREHWGGTNSDVVRRALTDAAKRVVAENEEREQPDQP